MKSVVELANPSLVGSQPHYHAQNERVVEITPRAVEVMDRLFDHLTVIFPAWHKSLPSDAAVANFKTLWLEEIINANIRNWKIIAHGLERCKQANTPFLPSVAQFIAWCKSEDYATLGLPDEQELLERVQKFQAYGMTELHRFKFRSNAEYWLITELYCRGRQQEWTEQQLATACGKALAKMVKRIKQGEQIPPQTTTIEEKKREPLDPRIQRILDEKNQKGALA